MFGAPDATELRLGTEAMAAVVSPELYRNRG